DDAGAQPQGRQQAGGRRKPDGRQPEVQFDGRFRAGAGGRSGRAVAQAPRDAQQAPRPDEQGGPLGKSRGAARAHPAEREAAQDAVGRARDSRPGWWRRRQGGRVMAATKGEGQAKTAETVAEVSLLDQVVSATKQTEPERAQELVRTLTEEVMKGTVVYNKNLTVTFKKAITDIDKKISSQLAAIMHDPGFTKLEGSWRGLHYL